MVVRSRGVLEEEDECREEWGFVRWSVEGVRDKGVDVLNDLD